MTRCIAALGTTALFVLAAAAIAKTSATAPASAPTATTAPASAPAATVAPLPEETTDNALAAAEKFVEKSDRYLHHSKLHRGMKGYGLTVMAGTKVERFDAEIVSVMTHWGPNQAVILARLSGLGLENSSIIAGMSGSPVFMRDPADGKDKIIGAVAYGWGGQKGTVCGVQPITQMLAVEGVLNETRPASQPAAGRSGMGTEAFLAAVLDPRRADFTRLGWSEEMLHPLAAGAAPRLAPLATPLMVSGLSDTALADMAGALRSTGLVPMKSGGVGAGLAADEENAALVPGGGIAVPLVSGDADLNAVGTVTDVLGKKVIAFGHAFFAEGETEFPMGPAYVHTVIAGIVESFKLGSTLKVTGVLDRDEGVGVAGTVGGVARTIPMTVQVVWKGNNRIQTYHYNLCIHRRYTPLLAAIMLKSSLTAWRDLPAEHTAHYALAVDFGELGKFESVNVSSGARPNPAMYDLSRVIAAMMNNPFGAPPAMKSITATYTIEAGITEAEILDLKLDGRVYKPGDTVTGFVTIRPFRKDKMKVPVKFELPADLPEGPQRLIVSDAQEYGSAVRQEKPQRLRPTTTKELLAAIQTLMEPKDNTMYFRLPLRRTGLALGEQELPDIPESKGRLLLEGSQPDVNLFTSSVVRRLETEYVLEGSATADFEVANQPAQQSVHE